jgi:5'-3' exonuclease
MDGNFVLHAILRAPGVANLKTSAGKNFGGVFGFIRSLRSALDRGIFSRAVVIWDGGRSDRRLAIYPGYKDRVRDEEYEKFMSLFRMQRMYIDSLLPMLGVSTLTLPSREGDDVIWWARFFLRKHGKLPCVIVSEDRDFCQMVDEGTHLFIPSKARWVTTETFSEVMKFPTPSQYLLYKSVYGDDSDTITGIPGVGKVTATKIAHGVSSDWSWDEVSAFCEASKDKRIKLAAVGIDIMKRNHSLVCLGLEEFSETEIAKIAQVLNTPQEKNIEEVPAILRAMEFGSIISNWAEWSLPFVQIGTQQ